MNDIEEMARILYCCSNARCADCKVNRLDYLRAKVLANAGYGDVKQAVRDFVDKLIDELLEYCIDNKKVNLHLYDIVEIIKKHRREVCGE